MECFDGPVHFDQDAEVGGVSKTACRDGAAISSSNHGPLISVFCLLNFYFCLLLSFDLFFVHILFDPELLKLGSLFKPGADKNA